MAPDGVPGDEYLAEFAERLGMDRRALAAVVGLTAVGLLARLVWLGARPMHFDEARVTYWGLRAVREGVWTYQPVVHGPLVQHLNRWLFGPFGSGDFVARLPVAAVGGLLPAAALLFRDRLRDFEVAALAGVLALNPLLLYYSRFMRSDVLVAAFAFVCLGALLRLYETRRPAYLYAASAALALAFASKENAIVYVLCWGGMLGLVAGLEVLDPRRFDSRAALVEFARDRADWAAERLRSGAGTAVTLHGLGAVVLFALLVVFLFARRAPPGEGVGLWHSSPVLVLQYVAADVTCGLEFWSPLRAIPLPGWLEPPDTGGSPCLGFGSDEDLLANFPRDFGRQLQILGKAGSAVALLSLVGVLEEFRRDAPRVLVPAAFYWGLASLLGYPVGADILFPPWVVVHSVVPLAIPAAVGLVAAGRWTADAVADRDPVAASALVVALVLLVGSTAGIAVHHAYLEPTGTYWSSGDGQVVQFAQPEHEMKAAVDATRRASDGDGLDVLVYDGAPGDTYALVDMGGSNDNAVPCMKFLHALPLSWYLYSVDATVECADGTGTLQSALSSDPPVVLTRASSAGELRNRLGEDYVSARYHLRRGGREVVFFFDATRVDPPARAAPGPSGDGTGASPAGDVIDGQQPGPAPSGVE